jgi:hypothetical protein
MSKNKDNCHKNFEQEVQEHQLNLSIMKMIEDNPEIVGCPDFQKMLKAQGCTLRVMRYKTRKEAKKAIAKGMKKHPDCFLTENAGNLF